MDLRPTREHPARRLYNFSYAGLCSRLERHTGVVVHVSEHIRDRGLALGIDTTSELADQTDLLVVAKPLCGSDKAL